MHSYKKICHSRILISGIQSLVFLLNILGPFPVVQADEFRLPLPGVIVHLSPEYNPPTLKGIKVHPNKPLQFDFILDKGDSQSSNDALKDESIKLIKYFLASLTVSEKDLWVNLSPYEKDRIIPQVFGLTEMGRDLLAEDYMLKQITASLIYPEGVVGQKFWKRIYQEAAKRFGTTNIPVNTFNKVWIVPEKAVVYENAKAGTAYVVESKLKVLLEQDYLSLQKHKGITYQSKSKEANQLGSQIVREIVIPELTKEVNESKNFSQLRQIYNSLILAYWYKRKVKDSLLEQVYLNKNKVYGVNIDDPKEKDNIYRRYLQAFKKGVCNYIKEDQDPLTQKGIPKKYFSGGTSMEDEAMAAAVTFGGQMPQNPKVKLEQIAVNLAPANEAMQANKAKVLKPTKIDLRNLIPEQLWDRPIRIVLIADNTGTLTENHHNVASPEIVQQEKEIIDNPNNYIVIASGDPREGIEASQKPVIEHVLQQGYQARYSVTWNGGSVWGSLKENGQLNIDGQAQQWDVDMRTRIANALAKSFYGRMEVLFEKGELARYFPAITLEAIRHDQRKALNEIENKRDSGKWEELPLGESRNIVTYFLTDYLGKRAYVYDSGEKIAVNTLLAGKQFPKIFNPDFFKLLKPDFVDNIGSTVPASVVTGRNSLIVYPVSKVDGVRKIFSHKLPKKANMVTVYLVIGDGANDILTMNTNFGENNQNEITIPVFLDHSGIFSNDLPTGGYVAKSEMMAGALEVLKWGNAIGKIGTTRQSPALELFSWQAQENQSQAMSSEANTGGIDLTPDRMHLQTQNKDGFIKFHIDPAMLRQLQNAPGFVPLIINLEPMNNLRLWLGLNDQSPASKGFLF